MSVGGETTAGEEQGAIDRSSPVPLYHQLEYLLRRDIDSERYQVGDPLPAEGEICRRYGVSRSVVRQTLTNLAHAGLIRTERGRGSFVAEQKLQERFVQRATGLYDDLRRMGYDISTRVVRQRETDLPLRVQEFLETKRGVQIDRVRSVDGRVLAFIRTFLSPVSCPGLDGLDLEDRSLYDALSEEYDLRIGSGRRTVEAVAAAGEVAAEIGVAEGEPVLLLRSASRDESGQPLEWFEAWHRGDRTMFEIEIVPGEADRLLHSVVRPSIAGPAPSDAGEPGRASIPARSEVPSGAPAPAVGDSAARGDELVAALTETRVMAVLRAGRYAEPVELAERLIAQRLPVVEFTLTGENALEAIEQAREVEQALVGAGTILSVADARSAISAGAQFLVAPIGSSDIVAAAAGHVPVILAGFTPSEVWAAWEVTQAPVKVFPASVGGPSYLKALAGPMPSVPLLPSGGISVDNLGEFLDAGAIAVNIGTSMCPPDALETGDLDVIEERARAVAEAIARHRDG